MQGCLNGNGMLGKEATRTLHLYLGQSQQISCLRPAPVFHQTQTNLKRISPDLSQVTKNF